MGDLEVIIGDNVPAETGLYNDVHADIRKYIGRLTPAQINGILFQVSLEVLDVFNTEEEGYTA